MKDAKMPHPWRTPLFHQGTWLQSQTLPDWRDWTHLAVSVARSGVPLAAPLWWWSFCWHSEGNINSTDKVWEQRTHRGTSSLASQRGCWLRRKSNPCIFTPHPLKQSTFCTPALSSKVNDLKHPLYLLASKSKDQLQRPCCSFTGLMLWKDWKCSIPKRYSICSQK